MENLTKEETLRMFDHVNRIYVRIVLNEKKKYWEKWVSKNKRKWELVDKLKSLDEVLKSQQSLIDNNFKNLYKLIASHR